MPDPDDTLPADYPTPENILGDLSAFADDNPDICTIDKEGQKSVEGKPIPVLRIQGPGATGPRVPFLVTGGVHAREWAPPLALLRFCLKLLKRAAPKPDRTPREILYGSFEQFGLIHFPSVFIDRGAVSSILANLDIYIVPLVNPDGYRFSRLADRNQKWRKNRGSNGPLLPCEFQGLDQSVGTDINRNVDAGWHVEDYFDPSYYHTGAVHTAMDACGTFIPPFADPIPGETYRGLSPFSEPETKRVKQIVDDTQPQYFVDVHSYGPDLLYGWGFANNQSRDDTQNFLNAPKWDHKRDAGKGLSGHGAIYGEFVPAPLLSRSKLLGKRMAENIKKMKTPDKEASDAVPGLRSDYPVKESTQLYPSAGITDYLMEKNYGPASAPDFHIATVPPARYPYTMECGGPGQGEFRPRVDIQYLKIEREVHLALWSLMAFAASPAHRATKGWPIRTGT
jgi:hypothetical protein